MADLILAKIVPAKRTVNSISQFVTEIIQILYEYKTEEEEEVDKKKTKKIFKKSHKDKVHVECQLLSGTKIDLVWYLLFRIVQKNLEEISSLYAR